MTVVFERPYKFVPPSRSTLWPWLIQRLRLFDHYLKRNEGVVDYELRGIEHLKSALDAKHGVLLAPNHCRYADPLVMGWPARNLGIHVHAMASWHLFNEGPLETFALRRMGAFSIFREGNDRQSIETAIEILVDGKRPLIIFPEGTTNRTNDQLKPLLDGVGFIARTAAKRRAKRIADSSDSGSGKVVVLPVAIKYLAINPIDQWADRQLQRFEKGFGWKRLPQQGIRERTVQVAAAWLALNEIQYLGHCNNGSLPQRRDALIMHVLDCTENELGLEKSSDDVRERVRQIRSTASTRFFAQSPDPDPATENLLRRLVANADFAQDLLSYPDSYLMADQATDTRIVETIQRMQESVFGKSDNSILLKAVIEFAPGIEVSPGRPPKGQRDPLMQQLESELTDRVTALSTEARKL